MTVDRSFFNLRVSQNVITVSGDLRLESLERLSSAMHGVVRAGYSDVILGFSNLTSVTHSVIPPLAANLRRLLRDEKIEFEYIEPRNSSLAKKITSLGLPHYIEHRKYPKPRINSTDASVLQFMDQRRIEIAAFELHCGVARFTPKRVSTSLSCSRKPKRRA